MACWQRRSRHTGHPRKHIQAADSIMLYIESCLHIHSKEEGDRVYREEMEKMSQMYMHIYSRRSYIQA